MTAIPYPTQPSVSVEYLNLWLVREFPRIDPDQARWTISVERGAWSIQFHEDADASLFLLKWDRNAKI